MTDRRRKTVVTVLCVGSVVLAWRMYALYCRISPGGAMISPAPAAAAQEAPPATSTLTEAGPDSAEKMLLEAQRAVEAQPWGRDPFDPAPFAALQGPAPSPAQSRVAEKPPAAPPLRFSGVSRAGAQWLAAVDGSIVRIGDTLHGQYRVEAITRTSVTLSAGGWRYHFELGSRQPSVRRQEETP
jgi:hypothetical protein